jgi:hypothetical protein
VPSDWGGIADPELRPSIGVSLWITSACLGMVTGLVLAVWAFRFGNGEGGLVLVAAAALAGLAMLAGMDYADISTRDESEGSHGPDRQ